MTAIFLQYLHQTTRLYCFYSNSFCRCHFFTFFYTTKIFIIWKYQLTQSLLVYFGWEIFPARKCKMQNNRYRDASIIPACTIFSLLLVKIWSMRVEVLNVTLVGALISCFNPRVEQNSIWLLTSEIIQFFHLDVFTKCVFVWRLF